MTNMLSHRGLELLDPSRRQLVDMERPLPPDLNPFDADGVIITPARLFGGVNNSKTTVAFNLIFDGIKKGKITPETTVLAASSGNTGLGVAGVCKILNLHCEIVMQNDTPAAKVGAITALGSPIDVTLLTSGTVEYARRKGREPGFYDTDQYGNQANLEAQYTYLAPQLWRLNPAGIDILVAPGGTLGTAGGLKRFATEREFSTKFILALCAPGHEVPGARDLARIERDVRGITVDEFDGWLCGTRYDSFLASYAMFSRIPWMVGGPTSGLAFLVALRFIRQHKDGGTLDQFRNKEDGKVHAVFLCPDSSYPYTDLYRSVLNEETDFKPGVVPVGRLIGETV